MEDGGSKIKTTFHTAGKCSGDGTLTAGQPYLCKNVVDSLFEQVTGKIVE